MFFYYDPTYILVIIGMILSLWASYNVNGKIKKYSAVKAKSGLTAAEAAKQILRAHGIIDVDVKPIEGASSDYYNTATKELCLLTSNYSSTSIAAIGIAAHECGHAIQDADGYMPLKLKNTLAPACAMASNIGIYIVLAGLLFSLSSLLSVGIILFSLGVFVSLLLLPIEYNASDRALEIVEESGLLQGDELYGARKVLRSAGLTYVAAAASSILTLLRLMLLSGNRRRR